MNPLQYRAWKGFSLWIGASLVDFLYVAPTYSDNAGLLSLAGFLVAFGWSQGWQFTSGDVVPVGKDNGSELADPERKGVVGGGQEDAADILDEELEKDSVFSLNDENESS